MNNYPIKLRPVYKDYLWGGTRLKEEFNKESDKKIIAESWECSTHPDGESIVGSGEYSGVLLSEYLSKNPGMLGKRYEDQNDIPILVKFIDAKSNLSIQVHPDDEYASLHENGQRGKTEMWYVLETMEKSGIYYGMKADTDSAEVSEALQNGTIEKYLNRFEVKKDDVFFINPGTVHAIGAGCLIVEIQESSNLTYRMFDYNRKDLRGNERELHLNKAVDVADCTASREPRQPLRVLKYEPGVARELLGRCRYFEVHRMLLNTDTGVDYCADELSFRILLCIEGKGEISFDESKLIVGKGDCIFIPAESVQMNISGQAQFLDIRG